MTKISVIIPTLNEAERIEGAIRSALKGGPETYPLNKNDKNDKNTVEVIVADAGSTDKTPELASQLGALVVTSPKGRGEQMDLGAGVSTGEILLFLHADTRLPEGWQRDVLEAMENPRLSGGAFTLSIDATRWPFRVVEFLSTFRAKHLGLIYGDQAIFTRRETFVDIKGFNKLPLFEDVDCVIKLKGKGDVIVLDKKVLTSPRQWEKGGIIRSTLRNWLLLSLYMLGFNARALYRLYYKSLSAR